MISGDRRLRVGIGVAMLAGIMVFPQPGAEADTLRGPNTFAQVSSFAVEKAIPPAFAGPTQSTDPAPPVEMRVNIYRAFAYMQGHLLVGDDLVKESHWEQALPHFSTLMEEWEKLSKQPATLPDVSAFRSELSTLIEAVKAKHSIAYHQNAASAQKKLTEAINQYRAMLPGSVAGVAVIAVNQLLKMAAVAYATSIEQDKFVKPESYQDSRGLIWSAELVYVDHSRYLESVDLYRLGEIRMLMNEMKAAFPTAMPPPTPIMNPQDMNARVAHIEQLSAVYQ